MDSRLATLIFLASRQFWALSQSLCHPDQTLEVVKEKADNAFTCTHSTANVLIWRVSVTSNSDLTVNVFCEISKIECRVDAYPEIFSANMTATKSVINVNTVSLNPDTISLFERGTLTCETRNIESLPGPKTECQLDYIYKPDMVSCNAQFITNRTQWVVIGKCIIDKIFSYRDRYICMWNESNGTSTIAIPKNQTTLIKTLISGTNGNDAYYSVECSFSKPLPEMAGNYTYTVIVYPGDIHLTVNFTGSNSIVLPAIPTPRCPNSYIAENTNVNCTCTATNLGTPQGKVAWSSSNESYLAFNVNRSHNNNNFTCEVRWGNRVVKQNVTTLLVAYGPGSVYINGPSDPFDTNGEQNLTLRCTALVYNPQVSYLFRRVNPPSDICSSNSCTLRPQPLQDNGVVYECLAINSVSSSLSVKVNYTLNINYPPQSPPSIVNYSDSDVVYSGDFLNMTCIVKGGLPSNATKVNFSCSGKPDENDIFGNDEVNSTITFTQLNEYDQGRVCNCTAKWKNYTWYTLSAQRILNVYYPPQRPNITARNKYMFPYLEGEYVSLSCDLIVKGNPPANLSWSFYRTTNESRTNETSIQMELQSLGKNDNNKTVTCSAENNFTQIKGSTVMNAFELQVYYRPILELSKGEDNACIFTSELWQCAVTEGQRIDIYCMADSNPFSGNITWHNANWTAVTFTNSSQLYIPSANKSEHNGIFTCRAITTKPNISDTRLPLSSTKDLYMLVKYMPCDITLILNTTATEITVMEKEIVTFVCRINGRPTPTVILLKQDNSTELFRVQGGMLNLADEITTLNYTIPHASCEDTGNYACSGENDVGKLQSNNTSLRVNCEPRFLPGSWQPNIIIYRGEPIITTFEFIAFPKIQTVYTSKLDNSCIYMYPVETTFSWTCDEANVPYKSVCRFLTTNATTCDAGSYRFTFVNGIGQLTVIIQLQVSTQYPDFSENDDLGAGAGAGITLAVVAVVVAIVLVILRHHRWVLPCSDTNIKSYRNTELPDSTTFSKIHSRNMDEFNGVGADENTTSVLETAAHTGNMYDSLKVEEIAVASEYESIRQQKSKDEKHLGQPYVKPSPNIMYANIPLKEIPR